MQRFIINQCIWINRLYKTFPKHVVQIIMEDFNARTGQRRISEHVGHGLRERNE